MELENTEKRIQELKRQAEFLRLLSDYATDMIGKHTPEGVFLYISPACRELIGYEPEELTGCNPYDFFHPDDIENVQTSHHAICEDPIVYTVAYRFRHKQGHYVWVETTSKVVRHPETGAIEFIITTTRDITPRRQAQEALTRRCEYEQIISEISTEFLGLSSEQLDEGIDRALATIGAISGADRAYLFLYREDGQLADNTHEWCAAGVEPQIDKLQGICVREELPWFSRRVEKGEVFLVTDVSALPAEARLERAHFEAQDIQSLIVVPMTIDNELMGFIGFDTVRGHRTWSADDKAVLRLFGEIFSNAIQRKRVEDELRKSEERWQFALEGSGDGVWDWDAVTSRVYFSSQWKAMLGLADEDIGSTLDEWQKRVHPEDMANLLTDLNRHFKGETDVYQNEHRVLCKDGSYKWILDRGKVIRWTIDGKPQRIIGTHSDISARKQAEAEKERLIAELQAALKEVKTLSGLLPICSFCKKIRDDQGYWRQIENYIQEHSDATFSHSLCRECLEKYYPDFKFDQS